MAAPRWSRGRRERVCLLVLRLGLLLLPLLLVVLLLVVLPVVVVVQRRSGAIEHVLDHVQPLDVRKAVGHGGECVKGEGEGRGRVGSAMGK